MRVLLAIDDSPCSTPAVSEVLQRDWPKDTQFHVMNVLEPFYPDYGDWYSVYVPSCVDAERERERRMCAYIKAVADKIAEKYGEQAVTHACVEGFAKEEIVRKAKDWPADLVMLGSHDRKGLHKWLAGSISQAVAKTAPCSVEIVREEKKRAS